jgi:SAM-dependent methyltransferase
MSRQLAGDNVQANYRFIVDKLRHDAAGNDLRVLDYGCGKGDIVRLAREASFDAFGVEKFYGGSDIRDAVAATGLLGDAIRELEDDGRIPFDDAEFDVVVSNQVFEHVEDLSRVVAEIARVLKPGGQLLCLFPSKGILREVHCGVPIVHWLPKSTRARYYWLLSCRLVGLGAHKGEKSRTEWAADFDSWLRAYTFYRTRRQVMMILGAGFARPESLESNYVAYRLDLKGHRVLSSLSRAPVLRWISGLICRLYGGLVFVARKDSGG